MATPAEAVQKATLPTLSEVDYGAVFQVVDSINASEAGAANVASLVELRLKNSDPRIVALCLELLQACIKNENTNFHRFIATDEFVELLFNLCVSESDTVAKPALDTLQQLGCEPQLRSSMPVFRNAYKQAKAVGLPFPVQDDAAVQPLFTPMQGLSPADSTPQAQPEVAPDISAPPGVSHPTGLRGSVPTSTDPAGPSQPSASQQVQAETQLLLQQLDTVRARVGEIVALVHAAAEAQQGESPASSSGTDLLGNEVFLDLLDFLEQCHPRLSLLVEVGNSGQLQADALQSVLELSEPLTRAVNAGKIVSGLVELPVDRGMADFDVSDLVGYGAQSTSSAQGAPAAAGGNASSEADLLGTQSGAEAPPAVNADATADAWAMDFGDEEADGLQSNTLPSGSEQAAATTQPASSAADDDGLSDLFGAPAPAPPAAASGGGSEAAAPPSAPTTAPSYASAAAAAPPTVPAATASSTSSKAPATEAAAASGGSGTAAEDDDDPFLQLAKGGKGGKGGNSNQPAPKEEKPEDSESSEQQKQEKSGAHSSVLDEVDDLLASS